MKPQWPSLTGSRSRWHFPGLVHSKSIRFKRSISSENVPSAAICNDLQTSGGGIAIIGQACAN